MKPRYRIAIVSTNLSTNCTNRCYRLALALSIYYDVKIVGTTFGVGRKWGEGLWPPVEGQSEIRIQSVRGNYLPYYVTSVARLIRLMNADLIIACKPRPSSFGIALIRKLLFKNPVILDIDDDELAQTMGGKNAPLLRNLINFNGYFWTRVFHWMHRYADDRFVVSEAYRAKYGGAIIPHPMDSDKLNPANYLSESYKTELGFTTRDIVIGFIGTPTPDKGLDLLGEVISEMRNLPLRLLIVGATNEDPCVAELCSKLGPLL